MGWGPPWGLECLAARSEAGIANQDPSMENNMGKLKQPLEWGRSVQKTRKH